MKPFLTARWTNLLNLTYRVPPELLLPHVPPGTELEVQDGTAFASIVAFDFFDTRVKGIPIPFHINFPEINLRFYLRQGEKRGVAFLRELVPRFWIAWVARNSYNEPYESTPMRSLVLEGEKREILHEFRYKGKSQSIWAETGNTLHTPEPGSLVDFFKEHEWGYGVDKKGRTLCYQVKHPVWEVYDLNRWDLQLDTGWVYGPEWAFLEEESPYCACLAKGSDIEVYPPFLLEK